MDFAPSDMQEMLIDSADRLVRDHYGVESWRARDDLPDGLDRDMWGTFAELGWLALPIAEDAGGLGGTIEDFALLMVALGKGMAVEPIVSTAILGAHLVQHGGRAERESMLAGIAAGDLRLALAHAEASDRYELSGTRRTVARRTGDGFVIAGSKLLALDAPSADKLIVSATIEGDAALSLFIVDVAEAGVTIAPYALIDGSRAADVDLLDVSVPARALLASGFRAEAILAEAVDRAAIAIMGQAIGAMEACLTICGDYAKERRQFGQPIGKFQAVQHLAAEMFVATFEARSALYHALAHVDDAASRSLATSVAKAAVSRASQIVARNGIQIHGGYGMTSEYAISHYYRRLLVIEKLFGDIDHHLQLVAASG